MPAKPQRPDLPASTAPEASASPGGLALLTLGALGVVYGDIGTSTLYTLPVCFAQSSELSPEPQNVMGIVSLIIWSLVIVPVARQTKTNRCSSSPHLSA
jgi:KUP system potassium uptake protein